jgi:hypothetical protein
MGLHRVEGKLTSGSGEVRSVALEITTRELPGGDDVARVQTVLRSADVPDGDYVLEYFCFGFDKSRVRVNDGIFLAPVGG